MAAAHPNNGFELEDDRDDEGSEHSSCVGYANPRSCFHCARQLGHVAACHEDGVDERTLLEEHPGTLELLAVRTVKHWREVLVRYAESSGVPDWAAVLSDQLHGHDSKATLYQVLCALGTRWHRLRSSVASLAQVFLFVVLEKGLYMSDWAQPLNSILQSGASLLMARPTDGRVPVLIAACGEVCGEILPELAHRSAASLLVPDAQGQTALDCMTLPWPSSAGASVLVGAMLECTVSHPFATQQLLRRSPVAMAAWKSLAEDQDCKALLLACAAGSSSEEEMRRLASEAELQESRSKEQLEQALCRRSLLLALTSQNSERLKELETEELQLKILHMETLFRQLQEVQKKTTASLQDELDRAKAMLQERDRENCSLKANLEAAKLVVSSVAASSPTAAAEPAAFGMAAESSPTPPARSGEERTVEVKPAPGGKSSKASKNKGTKEKQGATGQLPMAQQISERQVVEDIQRARCVGIDLSDVPGDLRQSFAEMRASLIAAVARLTHDLYESEVHFVQELLQNADDNTYSDHIVPRMSVNLCNSGSKPFFYSTNNEIGLQEKDVRAICDIARSSKQAASGSTTGCKGIGFKSVFRVCNAPHVLSKGWRFKFSGEGLGMLTPSWLEDAEYERLPEQVQHAHSAGDTVIYLPLASPGAVETIEAEMRTLQADTAQMLFFRRLCEVKLCFSSGVCARLAAVMGGNLRSATICEVTGASHGDDARSTCTETKFQIAVHGDVSVALPLTDEPSAQRIYSFLPVRAVGFNFAVQAPFNTTASRSDFHRSPENARRRDAIAVGFLSACSENKVAYRALQYLGHEPVEPFWRATWLDIISGLGCVPCVETVKNGLAEPFKCLLHGDDPAAKWISDELLFEVCGLYFVAASSPKDMLQHLGVKAFGFSQLRAIIQHEGGVLLPNMWLHPQRSHFFSDLYSSLFDALQGDTALLEDLFTLQIFPVVFNSFRRQAIEFKTVCGLYLNFYDNVSTLWQEHLVPVLSKEFDLSRRALALLTALHVEDLSETALVEVALRAVVAPRSIKEVAGAHVVNIFWSGLSVLLHLFSQGRSAGRSWAELGTALALPSDSGVFVPASQLRMRSFLGVERVLPEALSEGICAFVGAAPPSALLELGGFGTSERVMRSPLERSDSVRRFEWEVFLWKLGLQPVDLTSRTTAESIEMTLKLGNVLVDGSFWQQVLQLPSAVDYVQHVLAAIERMRVSCWLRRLPVFVPADRCVDIRDLFLFESFHTLGGSHLDYVVNAPASSQVHDMLRRLGVSVTVNPRSLRKCVHILRTRRICDVGVLADIYARLHLLGFQPDPDEPFIFVPESRGGSYYTAGQCSWQPLEDLVLQKCCSVRSLQEHYSRFGPEVCGALQRWVRASPSCDVEVLCETWVRAVTLAKGEHFADLLAGGGQRPSREDVGQALVVAFRAVVEKLAAFCVPLGGLCGEYGHFEEEFSEAATIRRYFSTRPLIIIPGSTEVELRSCVRCLRLREAYWAVDPALDDHPCAKYALKEVYGRGPSAEMLEAFFLQVLEIRHLFTVADLRSRTRPPETGPTSVPPSIPAMVEDGLDFRNQLVPIPRPPGCNRMPVRSLQLDGQSPPAQRPLPGGRPTLSPNSFWDEPLPQMPPHMLPPSRQRPSSSSSRDPFSTPGPQHMEENVPCVPRRWRICGHVWTWSIVSATGEVPETDFRHFDTRPLLRAMVLFGAMPPQVAFAYDTSGRCVCDQELLLDVRAAERAMEIRDPDLAASFWAMELAHAVAHQASGPFANHRFVQAYRDTVLGFFPNLMSGVRG